MEALLFSLSPYCNITYLDYFYLLKALLSNEGPFCLNNKLYQNVQSEGMRYLKTF